jgi:organic radical activating enzyme
MLILPPAEAADLVLSLAKGQPITITGGEPFDQAEALGPFVVALTSLYDNQEGAEPPHVIIYTGRRYEEILPKTWMTQDTTSMDVGAYLALDFADVLVDGPYIERLDHPHLQWRGSANQRPIDLRATKEWVASHGLDQATIPILLDWDTPTFEIVGGTLFATGGLLKGLNLAEYGVAESIPRCGEFENDQ